MKKRIGAAPAALLVCVALSAAACTQGQLTDGLLAPSPGTRTSTVDEGEPSPSASALLPGDDVLEVAINEPASLDPMRVGDPGSMLIARQLFEGLTAWDPIEEEAFPAAAEAWTSSNRGRRFTFELRPGATFHDGSPVRARDFVFAFERIAKKKNGSELAYILERIAGFSEINEQGSTNRLSGVRAPDDTTLVIDLAEPFYDLPALLTHPGLVPVPKKAVRDPRYVTAPIGNGPFQMVEPWTPGAPLTLRRFDGFLRTPPLDGIRFTPFPDAASSWVAFTEGDYDVAEVPADQIDAASATYGDRGFSPLLAGYYFGFNVDQPTLQNRKLRMAVTRGIDREFIATEIYRRTMEPPRGVVPVGMPGFQFDTCADRCAYDPVAARALVRDLPNEGRNLTLEYTQGHPHSRVATAVKRDLEAIGLKVKLRSSRFGDYLRRLREGDQQVYRLGWIAEYPVPDVFLSSLFESGSPDNHSGFSSNKVDGLLRRARAAASPGKREQLYVKAEQVILKSMPIAPIGTFVSHWAVQPEVQDLNFDAMGGFDAFEVSLTEVSESP